ncbi:MAG: NUDIX domain-containing protein [Mycobacterium leprae]
MYVNARAFIERMTDQGTQLLLQFRDRPDEPRRLELPGGTLEEYEPILDGLAREIREETGLQVSRILDDTGWTVWDGESTQVECLKPFFVYQTLNGPIDSTGFFFRCEAEGELTSAGDWASGHTWVGVSELEERFRTAPGEFHWLTQAALAHYFRWRHGR